MVAVTAALLLPLLPQGSTASNGNAGINLRKTVDSAGLTPVLALTLSVGKPQAIPGDALTYSSTVTNTGGVLGLAGRFVAAAHADTHATVVYYWDELQACLIGCGNGLGDPNWTALAAFVASRPNYQPVAPPAVSSGLSLTATAIPASDVTYPQTGDPILGTDIGPTATAAWAYQVTVPLTPAQMAILTDPNQVQHLRNVVHFEVQPRNSQAAQPFDDAPQFVNPLQAQANATAATNVAVTFTLPSGQTVQFTSSTIPALAALAPGASVNLTTTYTVPVIAAKGTSETDAAYLARLAALNGSTLRATVAATGSGPSGPVTVLAPPAAVTTEQVPIVGLIKSGPGASDAGTTVTYQLALKNSGGAPAGPLTATDTLSDGGSATVSTVPSSLAAGATATATASYAIPATGPPGTLTDTAAVTWKDANANLYGPVSSAFDTQVAVKVRAEIQTVTTSTATGNFFAEPSSAQSFVAKPGDTPAFQQDFPTIDFNPPSGIVPHNISGVGPLTRPFTDVTTDLNGDFAGTIAAQGNGQQAGLGALSSFDAVFTANLFVTKAGDVTFNVLTVDGFLLGFGGGATRVSGAYENPPPSATTPFKGYPLHGAFNLPGPGSPATYPVTVHFPAPGTYPYELDYFSCCGTQLSLTMTVATFTQQTSPLSVYVGYADGLRAAGSVFPFPWSGSPNVTFIGCPGCQYDAGALRFDNSSGNALTLDTVTVDIGGNHFDLWPHSLTVPANSILILTQTGQFNFDTSDFSNAGCGGNNGVIPLVNVTQGGVTTTFKDTGQILNTLGFDLACKGNESLSWQRIGGGGTAINVPLPPSDTLTLAPALAQSDIVGQTQIVTVAAMDGSGKPVANLPLTLIVAGANTQQLKQNTDAQGVATFSYVGYTAGTDSVNATGFIFGLRVVSNTTSVTWVIPNGGTALQAGPSITSPSPADGTVVTKPVPINATFIPPAGQALASWSVTYQEIGTSAVTLASGSGTPPSPLATFDPTLLINDVYAINISATASGGGTQTLTTTVAVSGALKLGRYITTYQDLSVPVNGFLMQVQRSYDSTDKRVGDFGIGWRVDLVNFRVTANRPLGAGGWTEYPTSCVFGLCNWGFKTSAPHYVTVTFPDQHTESFDFTPAGGAALLYFQGTAAFTARAGNTSTLEALDSGLTNGFDGNLYGASGFYNPTRFRLRTRAGQKLILDTTLGLVSSTDPSGNTLTVDNSGLHASNGQSIVFTRDTQGRITQIAGPSGETLRYSYAASGDLVSYANAIGGVSGYQYDGAHNLLHADAAAGAPALTQTFDASGRLVSITDAAGNVTRIASDVGALTQTILDPNGQLTTVNAYDGLGDLVHQDRAFSGRHLVSSYAYDSLGRMTSATDAGGATSHLSYDAAGDLLTVTDAQGHVTAFAYDANGNVLSIARPDGVIDQSFTYDAAGRILSITRAGGWQRTFSYDSAGHVIGSQQTGEGIVSLAYDANGRPSTVTNSQGNTLQLTFDASGRMQSSAGPLSITSNFQYDALGDLTKLTDSSGAARTFTYDGLGRLTQVTDASGHGSTVSYGANGHVSSMTDRLGVTTSFTYDVNGRPTTESASGVTKTFTYDPLGRLVQAVNPAATVQLSYDEIGRLIGQTESGPSLPTTTTQNTYDSTGNLVSVDGPQGLAKRTYDQDGRLASIQDAFGTSQFAYDSASRISSLTRPNQATDGFTYDTAGRLLSQTTSVGTTVVNAYTYTYTDTSTLASFASGGDTATYGRDAAGRLISVQHSDASRPGETFTYDSRGNRTSWSAQAGAYTHGVDDQLLSSPSASFAYDAEGQRTTRVTSGAVTGYAWTPDHKLASVSAPDGSSSRFEYDALGRRILVTDGSTVHAFAYDGDQVVAEYQNGSLAAGYTLGIAADQPLDMNRGGNVFYYLQDQHANVTALLSGSGAVGQTYTYSAYGVPGSASTAVSNPLTYAASSYDTRAGAYYSRARYYDPTNGVFLSQDPQLTLNPYSYANGDPIDFGDPTGLQNLLTLGGILKWDLEIGRRAIGCALGVVGVAVGLAYRTLTRGQQNPWVTGANAVFACAYGAFFPGFGAKGLLAKLGYVGFSSVTGFIYGFIVDVIDQVLKCGSLSPDFGQAAATGLYSGAAGGAGGVITVGSAGSQGFGAVAAPTLSTAVKSGIRSGSPPVTC